MTATKTIKHKGEEFEVSEPSNCTLNVTGKGPLGRGLTARISVTGNHYVIQVLNTQDNRQLFERVDPIANACDRIINYSEKTRREMCAGLADAFDKIES